MRTIGLIGGMSWESTALYYRHINEHIRQRMGGLHSAPLLLWSFDFQEIASLQAAGDWHTAGVRLGEAGKALAQAGAKALVICTNTMHKLADEVEQRSGIPLIHIADATAAAMKARGIRKAGLLATRFTMEQDFYTGRLLTHHGIHTLVPDERGRNDVHRIIYDELCKGVVHEPSRQRYLEIIDALAQQGAEAIILGCTEVGMLISQHHTPLPVFDTTTLHAQAAVEFMVGVG